MRKHLKEVRELAKLNWGKNIPERGTSQYKGPEADALPYLKRGMETNMDRAD